MNNKKNKKHQKYASFSGTFIAGCLMLMMLVGCMTTQNTEFAHIKVMPVGTEGVDCQISSASHQYFITAPTLLRVHNNGEELVFDCRKEGYEQAMLTVKPVQSRRTILHRIDAQISHGLGHSATIDGFYPEQVDILMQPLTSAVQQEMTPLVIEQKTDTEYRTKDSMTGQERWMGAPPPKPDVPKKPVKKTVKSAPKPQPKKADEQQEEKLEIEAKTEAVETDILAEPTESLPESAPSEQLAPTEQIEQIEQVEPIEQTEQREETEQDIQLFDAPDGSDSAAPAGL